MYRSFIGLCGRESAGKSTVSNFLCGKQEFVDILIEPEQYIIELLFGKLNEKEYSLKSNTLLKLFREYLDDEFEYPKPSMVLRVPDSTSTKKDFIQLSFAEPLKIIVCILYNIRYEFADGQGKFRELRETQDVQLRTVGNVSIYGKGPKTIRDILRYLGTDVFRTHLGNDIWVNIMRRRIAEINCDCVIPDVRFDEEAQLIKELNGFLICVYKSDDDFTKENKHISSVNFLKFTNINYFIHNNSTIQKLEKDTHNILFEKQKISKVKN
jgi:hypothetical protein